MDHSRKFWAFSAVYAAAISAVTARAFAADTLSLNSATTYQTIQGWVGVVGNDPLLSSFQTSESVNLAVNQLGLTSFRLDMPFSEGASTAPITTFQPTINGINPSNSNWASFDTTASSGTSFSALDWAASTWLQPLQTAVQAANPSNSTAFTVTTNPSWYNSGGTGSLPQWMQNNPGAYAEVLVAADEYLTHKYGITPTFSTIMNEAGNNNNMTPALEAQVITAMGPMLKAAGLSTTIDLGSGENAQAAATYADNAAMTSNVYQYVGAIAYHDYSDSNPDVDKQAVAAAAAAHPGVVTMENEQALTSSSFAAMYDDITNGNTSYWGVYNISGYSAGAGIQYINLGVDGASVSAPPSQFWNERQVMYYVRPGAVRIGASDSNSAVTTLAFSQASGPFAGTTVALDNTSSSSTVENITGLQAGKQYGVSYAGSSTYLTELGIQTATAGGGLAVNVPASTVLTVYPYSGNDAPEIFKDAASANASKPYLMLGGATSTALSVSATSPELSALSYDWSLVSAPGGATVTLANPTLASATANGLTVAGTYEFNIDVSDTSAAGKKFSSDDQVAINVFNGYPSPVLENVESRSINNNANGSSNQPLILVQGQQSEVRLVNQVFESLYDSTLSASSIHDTVTWTQVSGPATASLTNDENSSNGGAGFYLANGLTTPGTYVFQVNATDTDGLAAAPQQVAVTVLAAPTGGPAIANAAAAPTTPGHGLLSATVTDAGNYGSDLVNWWQVLSQPAGSNITFANEASPNTTFSVNEPGTYTFQLDSVDELESAQTPGSGNGIITVTINSVPEPSSVSLLPITGAIAFRRRKRTKVSPRGC